MPGRETHRTLALQGLRVLDLSRFIAGPLCAQNLADFGAEVIRVERPAGGDERRYPPLIKDLSLYIMAYNRNKLGITLDTRHPRAVDILRRLIAVSDVVVENYRPGTMQKMGLDWPELHAINSRTILTSISGWGQTGPNRHRAVFDAIAQAASGLMSRTGPEGTEPMLSGAYMADYTAASHATIGTLTALVARQYTGLGQHVDISLVDSLFSCMGTAPSAYALFGSDPPRLGNLDAITVPANLYRASDGYVYIHAGSDPLFPRLAQAMDRPDLAHDPRFRTHEDRIAHVRGIDGIVAEWVAGRTCDEVERTLGEVGVPCARAAQISDVTRSQQMVDRHMMVRVEHPDVSGGIPLIGQPVKLSDTPARECTLAPGIGEHNKRVYGEILGIDDDELSSLREDHVI